MSGFQAQKLHLRIGMIITVIRNIYTTLYNGSRVFIRQLEDHIINGEIVTANNEGLRLHIPRISLISTHLPFVRRQFPIMSALHLQLQLINVKDQRYQA